MKKHFFCHTSTIHPFQNQKTKFKMDQTNAPSTKGKGLGVAGMVVSLVALVIAIIPGIGAAALWIAVVGLVLSVVAFFMARGAGNPKKGMMIAGIIMGAVALALAIYWITAITSALGDIKDGLENMDTAALRKNLEDAFKSN
ncbi:MAG: hypothetical protein IM638_17700 [Bacteroidetes bacterium]|nr:hypothetical protein [Bacteroidota bacterium]